MKSPDYVNHESACPGCRDRKLRYDLFPPMQLGVHMKANVFRLALILLVSCGCARAYPGPVPGTEDIPKLIAASSLVCKGEVTDAPPLIFVQSSESIPRMTAVGHVRPDRCYKGTPQTSSISVLFDGFPIGNGPSFVLRKGDYRLFFLMQQDGKYAVVDTWFGALPISRELGETVDGADPLYLLELDLKAGLRDPNPERVLDSIRMLGNVKQLHSTAELKKLEASSNPLVKTYVWQALLRLKDYSVLPEVAEFFANQPPAPHELLLPRDRLFQMQFALQSEIAVIRDSTTLPYLEQFATSGHDYHLRMSALQALRRIGSFHSARTYLKELDDSNADNGFSAMQGLLSLAGGGPIDWVPTWKHFDETPGYYATECREWWAAEGEQKAKSQAQHTLRFVLSLPDNVRSDFVQIHYVAFRSGNGYADILREPAKQNAYELAEPAEKLKVLAYLPGCQFEVLELSSGITPTQSLLCRPLRTAQLKGQITNPELFAGKSAVVELSVVAHQIFGVVGGGFTTFRLAVSPIDSSGGFMLSLPDFTTDPSVQGWGKEVGWQFVISQPRTSNIMFRLRAADSDDKAPGLAIQSSYPNVVKFTAVAN